MPNTAATASGTAAGSATAANSKTQTPSTNSSANCVATSIASRVLPTPPTPVNVTNRCERSAACRSRQTSASRPIKLVIAGRKFPGFEATPRNDGKSVRSPGARTWNTPTGARHITQPSRPQIEQINTAEQHRRRLGHQDLTAVPGGHHPRRPVEHRAEVVPVPQFGLTGRQSPSAPATPAPAAQRPPRRQRTSARRTRRPPRHRCA